MDLNSLTEKTNELIELYCKEFYSYSEETTVDYINSYKVDGSKIVIDVCLIRNYDWSKTTHSDNEEVEINLLDFIVFVNISNSLKL